MADKTHHKHRSNRVFKSLHKPLTYLGVERTLFYFVCVGAVGAFNLFNSILAGIAVFIGGFAFGHWVTNSDPAFLRILARSERYKAALRRGETEHPPRGGGLMLRLDRVIKPWKESAALNDHINLYGFWNETTFLTKSGDVGMVLRVPAWTTKAWTAPSRNMRSSGWNRRSRHSAPASMSINISSSRTGPRFRSPAMKIQS